MLGSHEFSLKHCVDRPVPGNRTQQLALGCAAWNTEISSLKRIRDQLFEEDSVVEEDTMDIGVTNVRDHGEEIFLWF